MLHKHKGKKSVLKVRCRNNTILLFIYVRLNLEDNIEVIHKQLWDVIEKVEKRKVNIGYCEINASTWDIYHK